MDYGKEIGSKSEGAGEAKNKLFERFGKSKEKHKQGANLKESGMR